MEKEAKIELGSILNLNHAYSGRPVIIRTASSTIGGTFLNEDQESIWISQGKNLIRILKVSGVSINIGSMFSEKDIIPAMEKARKEAEALQKEYEAWKASKTAKEGKEVP